jgi:hypothetical protein
MAFGPKRGYSDALERRHIENLHAAVAFACETGHPLNLCIDINWARTGLGDDHDGAVLDKLMELSRKWLKRRAVAVFAQVEIRENPTRPYPCPNAHILLHCPWALMASFEAWFLETATRLCWRLDEGAVLFGLVGKGNPTIKAAHGRLRYMSKGTSPRVAKRFGITPEPQGRVYGKRVSISQDINRAARQRHAASKATTQGPHTPTTHFDRTGAYMCAVHLSVEGVRGQEVYRDFTANLTPDAKQGAALPS